MICSRLTENPTIASSDMVPPELEFEILYPGKFFPALTLYFSFQGWVFWDGVPQNSTLETLFFPAFQNFLVHFRRRYVVPLGFERIGVELSFLGEPRKNVLFQAHRVVFDVFKNFGVQDVYPGVYKM